MSNALIYVTGIRPRRPPDGRLIDHHHFAHQRRVLHALAMHLDGPVPPVRSPSSGDAAASFLRGQRAINHVMHQRALARARNAGDHHHAPQRNLHIDVFQIVQPRAQKSAACGPAGSCAARAAATHSAPRADISPSAIRSRSAPASHRYPRKITCRPVPPRPGPNRQCDPPPASPPDRAPPPESCCPGPAAPLRF